MRGRALRVDSEWGRGKGSGGGGARTELICEGVVLQVGRGEGKAMGRRGKALNVCMRGRCCRWIGGI